MQEYIVNRPDEAALERVLEKNFDRAAGLIVRLAWQAGLIRNEIQHLSWAQIDFQEAQILLRNRSVPISEELFRYLKGLRERRNRCSDVVVLSDRDQKPLTPQSISRLVRTALDEEGQTEVRLIDLRHDFVLRQLETHDWQYVSRITGIEAAALRTHFAQYLPEKRVSTRIQNKEPVAIDEFALWQLLREEDTSPAGVALWLSWQGGLQINEIIDLRWRQVDLSEELLRLEDREVPLNGGAVEMLHRLRDQAKEDAEYVLVAPRSGKPFDRSRISRLVRAALVRRGIDNVTLRDLRLDCEIRTGGEGAVLVYLQSHRGIGRNEAALLLNVTPAVAYRRLKQMARRGKLTQIGARYYLRSRVVPPERHREVILSYLRKEGFAYRQEIADLLGTEARQCRTILKRLETAGDIVQSHQQYRLAEEDHGENPGGLLRPDGTNEEKTHATSQVDYTSPGTLDNPKEER